jgi:D-alanyl-D-alanine carboxypeptidase/D-alanyl-D-alanine-endopeptidase (penicillin-binding protein 4)
MIKNKSDDLPYVLSYSFRHNGKEIQSFRSNLPVLPASNMKILTGFSSYKLLGMNHKFITEVKQEGKHIIFSGGPSPLLDFSSIESITDSLGIGNQDLGHSDLVIKTRNNKIDHHPVNPSWNYDNSAYSYQPKITNFSLNENCIPKNSSLHSFTLQDLHEREDTFIPAKNPRNNLKNGIIGISSKKHEKLEKGKGGSAIHAERLGDILDHMETVSCNYSAEVLFKYLSYARTSIPGSWKSSSMILMDELKKFLGYDPHISVADGSGLSRSNFVNTSFLSDLIMKIHLKGGDDFIRCLPKPGVGTLKNRLKSYHNALIFAKTGSLTGVAALSGYIYSIDTSFSIIINNYLGSEKMTSIIDDILIQFLSENEIS